MGGGSCLAGCTREAMSRSRTRGSRRSTGETEVGGEGVSLG